MTADTREQPSLYRTRHDLAKDWPLGSIVKLREPFTVRADGDTYTHGIVVHHVGAGGLGLGLVSLHLYNPDTQRLYVEHPHVPTYVDFSCPELILVKDARETGYDTKGGGEASDFHDTEGFKGLTEAYND